MRRLPGGRPVSPAEVSFPDEVRRLAEASRLGQEAAYVQHGATRCLLHSVAVAYYCDCLARRLGPLRFRRLPLLRGALLHDYFLYDWHDPDPAHRLHGFRHPARALANARRDLALDPVEAEIILRHMFPLTPVPPRCREAVLVCLVDKVCSVYEIFSRRPYPNRRIQSAYALAAGEKPPDRPGGSAQPV